MPTAIPPEKRQAIGDAVEMGWLTRDIVAWYEVSRSLVAQIARERGVDDMKRRLAQRQRDEAAEARRQPKRCVACGETKAPSEFAKKGDGLASKCKVCANEWMKAYRRANPELLKEQDRARWADDPDRKKKRAAKARYEREHERIRAQARTRYKVLYAEDPSPWRAAKARRHQLLKAVPLTDEQRAHSVAYRAAIRGDPCFYCGQVTPGDMHDDHYFPLSKGGSDHWWNLRRSCGDCNRRKHTYCGTWFLLRRRPHERPELAATA